MADPAPVGGPLINNALTAAEQRVRDAAARRRAAQAQVPSTAAEISSLRTPAAILNMRRPGQDIAANIAAARIGGVMPEAQASMTWAQSPDVMPIAPVAAPAAAAQSSAAGNDFLDLLMGIEPPMPIMERRGMALGRQANADRLDAQAMDYLLPDYVAGAGAPAAAPGQSYDRELASIMSNMASAGRYQGAADLYASNPNAFSYAPALGTAAGRSNQAASDRLTAAADAAGVPMVPSVPAAPAGTSGAAAYESMQRANAARARQLQGQMGVDINNALAGMDLSGLDFSNVATSLGSQGAGGGGGTGAGGSGADGGAGGGSGPNWATLLEQQRQEAVAMRQRLEEEYQSRRDELTGMFQFAETDEERAQIAFLMAELQDATDIAYQAITDGYYQATETAILLGERARQSGDVEAAAIEDLFARSGQRVADITGRTVAESGIGAGLVGGQALQSARDFEQLLAVDAAREAALSARMGGITAEDFEMFQGRLAAQEAAQQGALARESRAAGTSLQAQHAAAVQQRIAEDRRRLVQELQELQSQYGQLGYNYDAQALGTYGTAATLAQRDAEAAAGRAASLQLQRERAAWEQQQIIDQRAYEASLKPDWQTDELAAAAFRWDTMTDIQRAAPGAYEEVWGGILPGVEAIDPAAARAQREAELRMGQSNRAPLVELTDAQILQRAREIEEEAQAARLAEVDRLRADAIARNRAQRGLPPAS